MSDEKVTYLKYNYVIYLPSKGDSTGCLQENLSSVGIQEYIIPIKISELLLQHSQNH